MVNYKKKLDIKLLYRNQRPAIYVGLYNIMFFNLKIPYALPKMFYTIKFYCRLLMAFFLSEARGFDFEGIKKFKNLTLHEPQQLDSSSCGVFVCMVQYNYNS
jgi:hypothetical protein